MDGEFVFPPIDDSEILSRLPEDYASFLREQNGFVAFGGGLHVRGACFEPKWHSLRTVWEGPIALHSGYECVQSTDVPFAEDCMGDQFLIRGSEVMRLSAETGELESMGKDWRGFRRGAGDQIGC